MFSVFVVSCRVALATLEDGCWLGSDFSMQSDSLLSAVISSSAFLRQSSPDFRIWSTLSCISLRSRPPRRSPMRLKQPSPTTA